MVFYGILLGVAGSLVGVPILGVDLIVIIVIVKHLPTSGFRYNAFFRDHVGFIFEGFFLVVRFVRGSFATLLIIFKRGGQVPS